MLFRSIVANIVPDVLGERAAELCGRLAPRHGTIVLSGLGDPDVPRLSACYTERAGCLPDVQSLDDWRCLSFTRG